MTSVIILAGGGSTRMGRPKSLLPLEGRTLLGAHLASYRGLVDDMVVVGGAEMDRLEPVCGAHGARLVENRDWSTTMPIESLRIGVSEICGERCVVTPVDTVPVHSDDLRALLACSSSAVLTHQGKPGHPVLIGSSALNQFRSGAAVSSLRDLLFGATPVESAYSSVLLNFNRPLDWQNWANRDER